MNESCSHPEEKQYSVCSRCGEVTTAFDTLINELDETRAQVERLELLRAFDIGDRTLPSGLMFEHARLDTLWQQLVSQRDEARAQLSDLGGRFYRLGKARDEAIAQRDALRKALELIKLSADAECLSYNAGFLVPERRAHGVVRGISARAAEALSKLEEN